MPEGYEFFEQFGEKESEMVSYYNKLSGTGHKIGGYPFFTQGDIRDACNIDYQLLLFQIDTDDDLGIMWGDSGVANFFIREEDLVNLDFSKVLYNWDCY